MWAAGKGALFLWLVAGFIVIAIGIQIWLARISVLERVPQADEPIYQRRFHDDTFDSAPR